MSGAPLVIAHRGASAYRPENTMPAYALAVEMGSDMIEVDLHRTRDGEVVIVHDEELAGLGGRGEINDASLAEMRALDAGDGERVPTLSEMLDAFGAAIPFNLELKRPSAGYYAGLEAVAWEAVVSRGLEARTLFSSFFDPVLRALRERAAEARLGLLVSKRFPERAFERAGKIGAEAIHPERSIVDAAWVREAHDAGLRVYAYTVDEVAEMERLLALGVDGLFTNRPDRMRALVGTSEPGGDSRA